MLSLEKLFQRIRRQKSFYPSRCYYCHCTFKITLDANPGFDEIQFREKLQNIVAENSEISDLSDQLGVLPDAEIQGATPKKNLK